MAADLVSRGLAVNMYEMRGISGILLAAPILASVVAAVGVDPVHFAAIIATNLGMGLITPPTAPLLYFGTLIGKTTLGPMLKPTLVFVFWPVWRSCCWPLPSRRCR